MHPEIIGGAPGSCGHISVTMRTSVRAVWEVMGVSQGVQGLSAHLWLLGGTQGFVGTSGLCEDIAGIVGTFSGIWGTSEGLWGCLCGLRATAVCENTPGIWGGPRCL